MSRSSHGHHVPISVFLRSPSASVSVTLGVFLRSPSTSVSVMLGGRLPRAPPPAQLMWMSATCPTSPAPPTPPCSASTPWAHTTAGAAQQVLPDPHPHSDPPPHSTTDPHPHSPGLLLLRGLPSRYCLTHTLTAPLPPQHSHPVVRNEILSNRIRNAFCVGSGLY